MIERVRGFVPFGAPESSIRRLDTRLANEILKSPSTPAKSDDALVELLQRSFSATLLDTLKHRASEAIATPPRTPAAAPSTGTTAPPRTPDTASSPHAAAADRKPSTALRPLADELATRPRSRPAAVDEDTTIRETAARASVDANFLRALRRAENGGPGREFGVVSVPAPTYSDQARVAAETIKRNVERFEATGRQAIDPASGKYTQEFIEFFSRRYAPVGAPNDPTNLNRHHARNLIRLYAQVAPKE